MLNDINFSPHIPSGSTIVVGMSGGVDSSVSAAILKELGYNVIGMFMKNWQETDDDSRCTQESDYLDVVKVCDRIKIPYYTVNFTKEYRDNVFDLFLEGLKKGNTPNPDILCNKEIKFKLLLESALKYNAQALATGHYVQNSGPQDDFQLLQGLDPSKDQSYFIYTIDKTILKNVVFPVGGMLKKDVRKLAHHFNLPTAEKKDSTGICFIGKRDFREFLSKFIAYQPGNFETLEGSVVGSHVGCAYYTLGQRRGLAIGGPGEAWFVVDKIPERNVVIVAQGDDHPALYSDILTAISPSWVSKNQPQLPYDCQAKIRYRQPSCECRIEKFEDGRLTVSFSKPQRAITPEQAIVFYQGNVCLGGATIEKRGKSYFEKV